MTATFEQAREDMFTLVRDAALTKVTDAQIEWPDKGFEKPKPPAPWLRVALKHNPSVGGQASLAGDSGKRRYRRLGTLYVQVFTPVGEGLSANYQLCKIIADALEGVSTPRGVWFRNTRITEIGPTDDWQQINVMADFEYDEVK